jgi:hypothetical protein
MHRRQRSPSGKRSRVTARSSAPTPVWCVRPSCRTRRKKRELYRADHAQPARPPLGQRARERDAGRTGAGWRADGQTPRTGRAPGAGDGARRRPQSVSGTSVCLARRAVVWLDRTHALARRTGRNARPRRECWRGVSPVADCGRGARPVAGPLDEGKPPPRSPPHAGGLGGCVT